MLIINQWATDAASYITDDIKVQTENDMSSLLVNGECFAKSEDQNLINSLQYKLYEFVDKSKRTTDTFDIGVEMDMIKADA
jgi:hypothetical protein